MFHRLSRRDPWYEQFDRGRTDPYQIQDMLLHFLFHFRRCLIGFLDQLIFYTVEHVEHIVSIEQWDEQQGVDKNTPD